MRTPAGADPDLATVVAAQRGEREALDALAAGYLPLVYNIVGRAMNGHPDVDDVVQETMLRAVRGVGDLRDPAAFRSWLVAIAIRQVRDSYRDRLAQPPAVEFDAPVADFADQTIERLGLSGQRLQTAEATRWLDDDDRPVLALWWQEAAGELTRGELAAGLGLTPAHAAVRVARMRERLVTSRMIVHALGRFPPCGDIAVITAGWDGEPSPLWRKRLARHVRDCQWCLAGTADMLPAERLLGGLPLLAVPAGLAGRALGRVAGQAAARLGRAGGVRGLRAARHARHARILSKGAVTVQPKLIAVSLAVATCAAGGTFAVAHLHRTPGPVASISVPPPSSHAASPVPLATHRAALKQPKQPAKKPAHKPPAGAGGDRRARDSDDARGPAGPACHPLGAPGTAKQAAVQAGQAASTHAAARDLEQRAQGGKHLELHRRHAGTRRLWRVLVLQLGRDTERHRRPGERELRPDDLGRGQRYRRHPGPGRRRGSRPARLQRA